MIQILDCTLRDGGYVNDFRFGRKIISSIISKLSESNIEMIECGFLSDIAKYDEDRTFFNSTSQIKDIIGVKKKNILYVGMIALGEKEIAGDKIPFYDNTSIDAIRITFHKNEVNRGIKLCSQLMAKGYKIFMQPIGTSTYSDEELIELIKKINKINPYAFAIVDTLGTMYQNDLMHLFYLFDHNLNKDIMIGFHSHNNLQLSFSNALTLMQIYTKRNIVIDTSVFGMGRGAGNLCTELLAQYINENIEHRYNVVPLLEIIDDYLSPVFSKTPWGYSVPYYLSATHNCHPNYASHLLNKQTVSVKIIDCLLKQIPNNERSIYNKTLIENIYIAYQNRAIDDEESLTKLSERFKNKSILVIAPGRSIIEEQSAIEDFIYRVKPVIISVNFGYTNIKADYIFISNAKRYEAFYADNNEFTNLILTSNIQTGAKECDLVVNYAGLLNDNPSISDNAGMMLLKLLVHLNVDKIYLAGFDGFSENKSTNYFSNEMINNVDFEELSIKNQSIKTYIGILKQQSDIQFITKSIYAPV
jgi:4-hydroxy 2-oxovalerate aldolase